MNSKVIMKRIKQDFDLLASNGYEVVGVFLQGSQNYNLDTENSDIDTRAIVVPKIEDVILNKSPVSKTKILPDNSHLDVKDIRLMFECYKKQNINFIESLFTKYCIINPKYDNAFKPILENAERIAHYNNYAAIKCIMGNMANKRKDLEKRFPTKEAIVDKYGYDPKQLHHLIRYNEFLKRYIAGEKYSVCLISKIAKYLKDIKSYKIVYSVDKAREIADKYLSEAREIENKYYETHECVVDDGVDSLLNNVLLDIFKISLKE